MEYLVVLLQLKCLATQFDSDKVSKENIYIKKIKKSMSTRA